MGTSANVILIAGDIWPDTTVKTREVWFYRSYNGHPEDVKPVLKKLLREAKKKRIDGDIESVTNLFLTEIGKSPDNDFRVSGSNPDNYCSSEYFYLVDLTNDRIKSMNTCATDFSEKKLNKFKKEIENLMKEKWRKSA
jgi:hypothetical protein